MIISSSPHRYEFNELYFSQALLTTYCSSKQLAFAWMVASICVTVYHGTGRHADELDPHSAEIALKVRTLISPSAFIYLLY